MRHHDRYGRKKVNDVALGYPDYLLTGNDKFIMFLYRETVST
jgi:hypothetical protein